MSIRDKCRRALRKPERRWHPPCPNTSRRKWFLHYIHVSPNLLPNRHLLCKKSGSACGYVPTSSVRFQTAYANQRVFYGLKAVNDHHLPFPASSEDEMPTLPIYS